MLSLPMLPEWSALPRAPIVLLPVGLINPGLAVDTNRGNTHRGRAMESKHGQQ